MVEIAYFPKRCPCCKQPAEVVKKFSGAWWYECDKHGQLFFDLYKARNRMGRYRHVTSWMERIRNNGKNKRYRW